MAVKIAQRYITFVKAHKIMEREYERCKKYREDYYPENSRLVRKSSLIF